MDDVLVEVDLHIYYMFIIHFMLPEILKYGNYGENQTERQIYELPDYKTECKIKLERVNLGVKVRLDSCKFVQKLKLNLCTGIWLWYRKEWISQIRT